MKTCDHNCREIAEKLIEPVREAARHHGYAVAVHGTLKRDIDWIAVPWEPWASPPAVVAEAIRIAAFTIHGAAYESPKDKCPKEKPHGRLCWVFYLGGPCYIDLSVVPVSSDRKETV